MSRPLKSLPVIQHWDCGACTNCCRDYQVFVTDAERDRILAQGWDQDPTLKGVPIFDRSGWFSPSYSLHHREDGACVFLDEKGGCRIHAKFGAAAKPFACRVYPFVLVPTGDHWRVSLRFSCPSVTKNEGRAITAHQADLREYTGTLEERAGISKAIPPSPILRRGQSAPWSDLLQFVNLFRQTIDETTKPLEWRLRKCLALIALCREARFDKVTGRNLREFLEIIATGLDDEVHPDPNTLAPPGWIGRIFFRQLVAIFARKDSGPHQGTSKQGRFALLWAAWRFARGTKRIPQVHALMPETTFDAVENDRTPITLEEERLLTRYYQVKIESVQFAGPTNFNRNLFDGFEALLLTYPAIRWLTRVMRSKHGAEAAPLAVRMVDDNFGFNPLLGSRRQLFALRTLIRQGEIPRLIAWYSRTA